MPKHTKSAKEQRRKVSFFMEIPAWKKLHFLAIETQQPANAICLKAVNEYVTRELAKVKSPPSESI